MNLVVAAVTRRQMSISVNHPPQSGPRTVPVRSTWAGRGVQEKPDAFGPDNPLRTGTVRGPTRHSGGYGSSSRRAVKKSSRLPMSRSERSADSLVRVNFGLGPTAIELRSADFSPPRYGAAKTAGSGLKSALLSCRNSLNSMEVGLGPPRGHGCPRSCLVGSRFQWAANNRGGPP